MSSLPVIAVIFLLAGLVKGVTGLGLPTVAMGLLGLTMSPAAAASLVLVPSLATNLWQMVAGRRLLALARRLWPMSAGICLGTWAGAGLLAAADTAMASFVLGAALVVYASLGLLPGGLPRVRPSAERWLGPLAGAATGLVTAATGIFVIPAVPYLQALGLERDELVQALGLSFSVSTVALAASLAGSGAFGVEVAGISLLALAPALLGMAAGQHLRRLVRPDLFRRGFFAALLLLGAHLALKGLA